MSDWERFDREADLQRSLHDCGAVLLTRGRRAGFGGGVEIRRTYAYPTSPGSGGAPADFDYMRDEEDRHA